MMSAHIFRKSKVRERDECMCNSFGLVLRTKVADEMVLSVRLATAGNMFRTITRIGPDPCDHKDGHAA